jgi:hypothetical protein
MAAGLDNPFAWLGIPAGASLRDIRRKLDEFAVQANLGLAPDHVTMDALTEARRTVEDVRERLRAELLWLLGPAAVGYSPEIITTYEQLLEQIALVEADPLRFQLAAEGVLDHDLGILHWAAFLERPQDLSRLTSALEHLREALEDEEFWARFKELCVDAGDPRSVAEFDSLGAESRQLFLDPVISAIRAASSRPEVLQAAIRIFRDSGWPLPEITRATQGLLASLLAPANAALEEMSSELDRLDVRRHEEAWGLCRETRLVADRLRDDWLPAIQLVRESSPEGGPSRLGDGFARQLMRFSPMAWPTCELGPVAMRLLQLAIEYARTSTVRAQVTSLQDRARNAYHTNGMEEAIDEEDWPLAAGHLSLLGRYAPPDERLSIRQLELQAIARTGSNGQFLAAEARRIIEAEIDLALRKPEIAQQLPQGNQAKPSSNQLPLDLGQLRQGLETPADTRLPRRSLVKRALAAAFGGVLILRGMKALSGGDPDQITVASLPSMTATKTVPAKPTVTAQRPRATVTPQRRQTEGFLAWEYVDSFDQDEIIDDSDPQIGVTLVENGKINIILNRSGWHSWVEYADLPTNSDYVITARVSSVSGTATVGVGLASTVNDTMWVFCASPTEASWSVYLDLGNDLESKYEVEPRYTFALKDGKLTELSLSMIEQVPSFRINGINVAEAARIVLPPIKGPRATALRLDAPSYRAQFGLPVRVAFDSLSVRAI